MFIILFIFIILIKICFNFVGQPRNIYKLQEIYNNFLHHPNNECYILYTTWKTKDINLFQTFFPNVFIKYFDLDTLIEIN